MSMEAAIAGIRNVRIRCQEGIAIYGPERVTNAEIFWDAKQGTGTVLRSDNNEVAPPGSSVGYRFWNSNDPDYPNWHVKNTVRHPDQAKAALDAIPKMELLPTAGEFLGDWS